MQFSIELDKRELCEKEELRYNRKPVESRVEDFFTGCGRKKRGREGLYTIDNEVYGTFILQ